MNERTKESGITVRVDNTVITTERTFGKGDMVEMYAQLVAKRVRTGAA